MSEHITFCRLCESHCGVIATVENDKIVAMKSNPDHPVSKGFSCPKGVSMHQVVHDPKRILHPLRKKADGGFERISWKTAIKEIGARLNHIRAEYGEDALGFWYGNPIAFSYSAGAWVKGMKSALDTPHFYTSLSQDSNPHWVASKLMFGSMATVPVPDVLETDLLLMIGANPIASHASMLGNLKVRESLNAIMDRGGRVVVVDPRQTETAELCEHLPIHPSGDAFLMLSILQVIFAEGLEDLGEAEPYTIGLDQLKDAVKPYPPEVTAQHTGISAEIVTQLARDLANAECAAVYGRLGACTNGFGTLLLFLMNAVSIVTGNADKRGGLIFPTPPVDLATPAIESGGDVYGSIKSRVGGFPDVLGGLPAGIMADEINTPGKGQLRSLIAVGGDPVHSIPESARIKEALDKLDLLVSLDFNFNGSNQNADYILPVTTFLEREDLLPVSSLFQLRPFAIWTEPVIAPRGEARQEWEIIRDICAELKIVPNALPVIRRMGWLGRKLTPQFLTNILVKRGARDGKDYGLSIKKLKKHPNGLLLGDRMPVGVLPDRLLHADKRLHLFCDEISSEIRRLDQSAVPNPEFPFRMFGRRESRKLNFWMKNASKLRVGERGPACLINPVDAKRLGLTEGELGRISSSVGSIEARFELSDDVFLGSICVPHGWSKLTEKEALGPPNEHFNANDLNSANAQTLEPLSGTAVLNGTQVHIEAINDYRKSEEQPVRLLEPVPVIE